MTGRRAMLHQEQRISRMEQFIPGHVGGRVDSAQPVLRRNGTLNMHKTSVITEAPLPPGHGGGNWMKFTATLYAGGLYGGLTSIVFHIVSPADDIEIVPGNSAFHAVVAHPDGGGISTSTTRYEVVWNRYGGGPWDFMFNEAPLTITDPDWYLVQGVGGGDMVWNYTEPGWENYNPGLASLKMVFDKYSHVGVLENIHLPGYDWTPLTSPIFRFPTLPLPFTFEGIF